MLERIKELERAHRRVQEAYDGLREGNTGPTAEVIVAWIDVALRPAFGKMMFNVRQPGRLGPDDAVYLSYASVPDAFAEIDALNAKSNPMFSITGAKHGQWPYGKPSPDKLKIQQFRGSISRDPKTFKSRIKFRQKTGSAQEIVTYIVNFFMKHKAALLDNDRSK